MSGENRDDDAGVGVVAVTENGGVKRARSEGVNASQTATTKQEGTTTTGTTTTTKKKQHEEALIGNYAHYYGYRCGSGAVEDRRLELLPRELFAGRECLDVGCNSGVLTLALARRYRPTVMVGVDADAALVERARRSKAACGDARAQHAVSYFVEDFVARPTGRGQYDTVTCLSVTKWVQLAHGDAAQRAVAVRQPQHVPHRRKQRLGRERLQHSRKPRVPRLPHLRVRGDHNRPQHRSRKLRNSPVLSLFNFLS